MNRFYFFLTQGIDRGAREAVQVSYPKAAMPDLLSINHVVKANVEQGGNHLGSRIMACRGDGAEQALARHELRAERAVLAPMPMYRVIWFR